MRGMAIAILITVSGAAAHAQSTDAPAAAAVAAAPADSAPAAPPPVEAAAPQPITPAPPPAPPVPVDPRPVLWQNVRYGMTIAEVRALYPERGAVTYHGRRSTEIDEVTVVGECKAEVNIYHEGGTVDHIVVNGDGSLGGRCSDTVLTALSSRYGQPAAETRSESSILAREGRVYVWNRDGVTLRLKRFSSGVFGGGGLMSASWELTYSAITGEVAL